MSDGLDSVLGTKQRGYSAGSSLIAKFESRYTDAYRVASAVIGFGTFFKVIGIVLAIVLVISSFIVGAQEGSEATAAGFGIFFSAVLTGLVFYGIGTLISAQGQIVRAALDTAVNTSPHMDNEEKINLMFHSETVSSPPSPIKAPSLD